MFLKVYCSSSVTQGDVLHYNTTSQLWEKATGIDHPLCVASEDAVLRNVDTNDYAVKGIFAGPVLAKASRSIPVQGGELQVENGSVFVDNTADGCGIICPQFIDNASSRNAGDLVQVIIR
jgi:hypothetical protein